ncbi:MAG: MaoC family dehydratase [Janthinobacterium lividum]
MTLDVGSRTITEKEIVAFATEYDPQPFHVDQEAAARSIYGGVIASGWQTCAIMMRLVVDSFMNASSGMGSPGVDELRWIKPLRGGDTLRVTVAVTGVRGSSSKPDRGVMNSTWEGYNQHGELVVSLKAMALFMRRPA